MNNQEFLEHMLIALESLPRRRVSEPAWRRVGICWFVDRYFYETFKQRYWIPCGKANDWLRQSFISFGLDRKYPVGGPDQFWDEVNAATIWENPKRIALLNKLIKLTEKQLKEVT